MIKKIDDLINLSEEFDFSRPVIQMEVNDELVIFGESSILDYDAGRIRLSTKNLQINIEGSSLTIDYIDRKSLTVKGEIKALSFSRI